jgi:hypothetical protein
MSDMSLMYLDRQIGELGEAMLDDYLLFCEKALLVPGGTKSMISIIHVRMLIIDRG